jgi:hypothetical protein
MNSFKLPTDKLKKFIIRRKWQVRATPRRCMVCCVCLHDPHSNLFIENWESYFGPWSHGPLEKSFREQEGFTGAADSGERGELVNPEVETTHVGFNWVLSFIGRPR